MSLLDPTEVRDASEDDLDEADAVLAAERQRRRVLTTTPDQVKQIAATYAAANSGDVSALVVAVQEASPETETEEPTA